ncbi:MAG: recombination mediator RecR [Candidatus Bipolaricaulota bacterium]|nr:recombination mediator RecR [Candidatus Bipolaricaulota bacterium]
MIAPLEELITALKSLPGIGRKSAERMAFHLLNAPRKETERLAQAITKIKTDVHRCTRCNNFAVDDLCDICANPKRDEETICVVGQPWEIMKIERTGIYRGLYHVLGGLISPMDEVQASDLAIDSLIRRVRQEGTKEVIVALEPKLEGEITSMHIVSLLKPLGVKISQIAQGIPVGRDLEFADEVTLGRAIKGRVDL